MRLWTIALLILFLLVLIPFVAAQDRDSDFNPYTVSEDEEVRLDDFIGGFGCPVGIREANRDLLVDENGYILAGQIVRIPRRLDRGLCTIEYAGEYEYFEWDSYGDEQGYPNYIWEIEAMFNVCENDLRQLNPNYWLNGEPIILRIPLDTPECFRTVELRAGQSPFELALELNICENLIWYYNNENIYEESDEARSVSIPLTYMPCYVDGQVLVHDSYLAETWKPYYIPADVVLLDEPLSLLDFAIQESYCYKGLEAANRGKSLVDLYQQVYIPVEAPRCQYLEPDFEINPRSMVEIAREYNVCLESLLSMNYYVNSWTVYDDNEWGVWIPIQEPCYDENGLRLGHNDRAVHQTRDDDWLFRIAQEYQVCIADLYAANPLLKNYPGTNVPSIVFIPDVPACSDVDKNGFIHHIVREPETWRSSYGFFGMAYIYNVCEIEIIRANPDMVTEQASEAIHVDDAWAYTLRSPLIGETILIPVAERPCYNFDPPFYLSKVYSPYQGREIEYICYAEEIDPRQDYTGHEPVITPLLGDEGPYCYDRLETPFVVIENVSYAIYPYRSGAFVFELAECFGVSGYDIIELSYRDMRMYSRRPESTLYWGIPNPSRDCPFIGDEPEAAWDWSRNFRERHPFGGFNEEGEYGVQYGDTLSSIGRRFGYLPEWIMAENNLPSDRIYAYQTLRLPNYPNLYQIAGFISAIMGFIGLFFGSSFVLRLRANRRKGKKKNDE